MEHSLETAYPLKSMMESVFGRKAWLDLKHCQYLSVWEKILKASYFGSRGFNKIDGQSCRR
ncbi:hypothetical protein [Vibrio parahaemolyticus]|uniref:hypothetical protein n=1 Tax=Vibrio parahaemolyticus TaxID=670 RepID=UPI001124C778|nr:hypothetical protein [Vibrio parahaemolyticus]